MLGIGLRTKIEAAYYLMNNNLLGSRRFALVIDEFDLDQKRMHLDTYFNILNNEHFLVLDFDDCSKICGKIIKRKVYLYDRKNDEEGIKSDNNNIKSECGFYKLN
jgi:arginine deiminase